ncbi:MAG: hypothetical protein GF355_16200 [Candidatus Eisenbacteria bacterium]|nr:hypothetical protein [Candidatus Eisenbacteria bacterium]
MSWGIELIIVFVGVYAAFALSEHQQQQRAQEHREQIRQALVREIESITVRTGRAAVEIPRLIAQFDSSMAAGEMPPLIPLIEPLRVRAHLWEATLESGGLNLLDVPTLYRISEFYNSLNAGFEQQNQLRGLSERVLIPNLGKDKDEFYDPSTRRLRPKYSWYLDGLRRISRLAAETTQLGEVHVADLKEGQQEPLR